ncbi:ligand-binding protein SH3 [Actinokineospora bangkokensis]|uniref:Ligand-binding protein SH3 n=2 Tax=Actinokineospora bangkokensis TaxID=1193682 RepID=A0A1Q9LKZ2_9PSEU|nr:ligand-binding protein SH3 [Actinokineospora bangkokensis]
MKYTEGFTRLWPTLAVLTGYGIAFTALAQALKAGLEVGVGYAIWSGLGTVAIVAIGVVLLGEQLSITKVLGILLVVAGVVLLNLGGAH